MWWEVGIIFEWHVRAGRLGFSARILEMVRLYLNVNWEVGDLGFGMRCLYLWAFWSGYLNERINGYYEQERQLCRAQITREKEAATLFVNTSNRVYERGSCHRIWQSMADLRVRSPEVVAGRVESASITYWSRLVDQFSLKVGLMVRHFISPEALTSANTRDYSVYCL